MEKLYEIFVIYKGSEKKILARHGEILLDVLQENGFYLPAVCGKNGTCGKCSVRVKGVGDRLACLVCVTCDMEVCLNDSEEQKFQILSTYEGYGSENFSPNLVLRPLKLSTISKSVTQTICNDILEKNGKISFNLLKRVHGLIPQGLDLEPFNHGEDTVFIVVNKKENKAIDIQKEEEKGIFAVSIDIGTTTIALSLVDLLSGKIVATHSRINKQRKFGADVISRIVSAQEGNLEKLKEIIQSEIALGIFELLKADANSLVIRRENIYEVLVAGNTTMLHLLLGISPNSLGLHPFKSTLTTLESFKFSDVFIGLGDCPVSDACELTILPSISSYVGADITAGIGFLIGRKTSGKSLLIDIGTNGEMAIFDHSDEGDIVCTSTAAGPAFEGGNMACGTGSVPGAISKVFMSGDVLDFETIGGELPCGICGSGVMDLVAVLVDSGLLDERGVLDREKFDGRVNITEKIFFTQKDVRELQLAKSAIRAGIEVLLIKAGVVYDDIGDVYLAGGFGFKMNIKSAVTIGIIPKELEKKVKAVGNSSLAGATFALLDTGLTETMKKISDKAVETNLSTDSLFNKFFMEHMYF